MTRLLTAALLLSAAAFPSRAAAGEDFTLVGGPTLPAGSVPDALPAGGLPVLWEADLGQGYSGFAVSADGATLFTLGQTLLGQSVLAVDAATGEERWSRRVADAWNPAGLYPGPRSTPALRDGRVFYTEPHGTVGCLNAADGAPVWSFNLSDRFAAEPVAFGYSCPPTLADGRLYLPVGGEDAALVALDPTDGRTLWQAGADAASHCPAVPLPLAGRPLVLGYLRNALVLHDRETGEQVWREKLSDGYDEHAARPIYREPHLWLSGPFRAGSELWELTPGGPDAPVTAKRVWARRTLSNDVCSSVLVGGNLYGFDLHDVQAKPHRPSRGAFRCVDLLTGEVNWTVGTMEARRRSEPAAVGQCTVRSDGERLLLLNDSGELILAAADPTEYRELGRTPLLPGAVVWTPPRWDRGRLFARHHGRAIAVRLSPPDSAGGDIATAAPHTDSRTTAGLSPAHRWTDAVLPAEPEYMMDAPTAGMLRDWFLLCLGLLWASAAAAAGLAWLTGRRGDGEERRPFVRRFRWGWAGLAFVGGAAGTTAVGHAAGVFLFTWPLALHAGLWATTQLASRPGGRRTDDLAAVGLLGLFALYFWLCRRLGLAFEWSFLAGPPTAVPFAVLARRLPGRGWGAVVGEVACGTLGFAASYAVGCGLLWWRYG